MWWGGFFVVFLVKSCCPNSPWRLSCRPMRNAQTACVRPRPLLHLKWAGLCCCIVLVAYCLSRNSISNLSLRFLLTPNKRFCPRRASLSFPRISARVWQGLAALQPSLLSLSTTPVILNSPRCHVVTDWLRAKSFSFNILSVSVQPLVTFHHYCCYFLYNTPPLSLFPVLIFSLNDPHIC